MNEQTMIDILLTPHLTVLCKQDPRRCHQLHLCDCPDCRETDRYEEQRDVWLNDKYDEAREMEEELEKDDAE